MAGLMLAPVPAHASYSASQISLDDDTFAIQSVHIYGINQNGSGVNHCWNTPNTYTHFYNWWWQGNVTLIESNASNCPDNGPQQFRAMPSSNPLPWFCYSTYDGWYEC